MRKINTYNDFLNENILDINLESMFIYFIKNSDSDIDYISISFFGELDRVVNFIDISDR